MPYAFDLIDMFGTQNKVIGLKIFSAFATTFCSAKDQKFCSENLLVTIFDQLKSSIVHRDLEVVVLLFPILIDFHSCLLLFRKENTAPCSFTLHFFDDLLSEMERSCTAPFRRVIKFLKDLSQVNNSFTRFT